MGMSGGSYLIRRHAIALVPLIALVTVSEQARAICTPPSTGTPVTDTIVTCTGTTINQNNNIGYGLTPDTGNIYNIVTGASLTGRDVGLLFNFGTVNNDGAISGIFGVKANNDAKIANSSTGTISGSRFGIVGIHAIVSNSGSIT